MINKTKSAFTLAEVLITLVIIGIVAALTISAVINTYVERSTVSKVKKGLSTLAQAKKLAEAQNGSIVGWDFGAAYTISNAEKFWKYLKPHFSLAKDCGSGTECYQSNGTYRLNGLMYFENFNTLDKYYKVILVDGSVMWFKTAINKCADSNGGLSNVCAVFSYDINGSKKPNTIRKDIFQFMMAVDGIYPNSGNNCRKNSDGYGCSSYIIKYGNMNYLH